jgi:hypothetical protein
MAVRIASTPARYPFSFVVAGDSGAWPDPTADAIYSQLLRQVAEIQPAPVFYRRSSRIRTARASASAIRGVLPTLSGGSMRLVPPRSRGWVIPVPHASIGIAHPLAAGDLPRHPAGEAGFPGAGTTATSP